MTAPDRTAARDSHPDGDAELEEVLEDGRRVAAADEERVDDEGPPEGPPEGASAEGASADDVVSDDEGPPEGASAEGASADDVVSDDEDPPEGTSAEEASADDDGDTEDRSDRLDEPPPGEGRVGEPVADVDDAEAGGDASPVVAAARGRPRSWLVLGTSMLLASLIPTLAVLGGLTLIDSREGRTILLEGASAVTVLPSTPAALVVHVTDDGAVADLTVLTIGPSGRGGAVVNVPVATEAPLPSGRVDRLDTAYAEGGLDELREAVEGVLNVRFDVVSVLDDDAWSFLADTTGPVAIELLDPVLEAPQPDGVGASDEGFEASGPAPAPDPSVTTTLPAAPVERWPAGRTVLTPDEVGSFLATRGVGESEIARLVRVQAFWEAWLAALGDTTADSSAPPTTPPPRDERQSLDLQDFLARIPAGSVRYEVLPVTVPDAPSADGVERYAPDIARIRLLAAEVAPSAVTSTTAGTRVRLVDPIGDRALLENLVANLVFLGANIVIASGSDDDPAPTSEIEYYGEDAAEVAGALGDYLGTDRLVASDDLLEGLDLTIVMGEDLVGTFGESARDRPTRSRTTTTTGDPASDAPGGADTG